MRSAFVIRHQINLGDELRKAIEHKIQKRGLSGDTRLPMLILVKHSQITLNKT